MSLSLVTAAGPSPDYVQGNKDKASRVIAKFLLTLTLEVRLVLSMILILIMIVIVIVMMNDDDKADQHSPD